MIRLFALFVFLGFAGHVAAQGWERTYGGGGQDVVKGLARTPDGGYIMAGYYSGITRIYLIKTDADGDLQWSKTFPAAAASGNAVLVTRDSGYAVTGFLDPNQGTKRDVYLLKTDAAGNQLWSKIFGGVENDEGNALVELPDGSLVVAGFRTDNSSNLERAFVAKVDALGNTQWTKILGQNEQTIKGLGLVAAPNGDVIVVGEIKETVSAPKDIYVIRLSPDGTPVWENTYGLFYLNGDPGDDYGVGVTMAADGGLVIAGNTNTIQNGGGVLLKIDADGSDAALWYKTFSDTEFRGVSGDNYDGFFVTGGKNLSVANVELYVLHTDAEGDNICDITVGKGGPDIGFAVVATPDGGAAAAGSSQPIITTFEENPYLVRVDAGCLVFTSYLSGNIFYDFDADCLPDAGETPLEDWLVRIEKPGFIRYAAADEAGDFLLLVDTGTYNLQLIAPNTYWKTCDNVSTVAVPNFYDTIHVDVPVRADFSCPRNEVDVTTPVLRNCVENTYTVRYCNSGTVPSFNTTIDVVIDPALTVTSSSQSYTQDQDTLTFDIGTVPNGHCDDFVFTAILDCDAQVGATYCVTAHIYPDSFCNIDACWDQAIIQALGKCDGDTTISLSVKNVGTGALSTELDYIIVEDIVMLVSPSSSGYNPFADLDIQEEQTLWSGPANGKTYRLIAEQTPCYPGVSIPTAAVEGCLNDTSSATVSLGYYTMFPNDDADAFVSTDCQESFESDYHQPSFLKRGHPKGYDVPHYVDPTTDLEFLIHFQNTGTDTVHQVIIRDTLSGWLDPTTVHPGTASHPYDFELYGPGIVQFTIPNLNLYPDGSGNSEGYVKFRVSQQPSLPCGTQILNTAAIYFDFNAPVVTNQTYHTVCEDSLFLPSVATKDIHYSGANVRVFPNPFTQSATFEITGVQASNYRLELYDNQGRLVFNHFYPHPTFRLFQHQLPTGALYYRLAADGRPVASGKIISASGQ